MSRLALFVVLPLLLAAGPPPKSVALIAGTKSHGPGDHEYERGMRLLKACLESSPNVQRIKAEVYTNGWPVDPKALESVDTIVLFCDGSDRDPKAHPILRDDRLATIDRLMKKGVGLVAIHYAVFVPSKPAGADFLNWIGGYFDYEDGDAPNHWYSKIQNVTANPRPASKDHPVSRGLAPFPLKEEYYYKIRFPAGDRKPTPILEVDLPGENGPQVIAWATERPGGGRGFGYTGGHYHHNWGVENVRKMVLNAILWTAHVEVPEGGVQSSVAPESLKVDVPPIAPGRFGGALDPRRAQVAARPLEAYRKLPITVDCWAKLESKAGYNILVACGPKESATHWEIYSDAGTGSFHAYLPGSAPALVNSGVDIVDGKWHHVALALEDHRARLFVDAKLVADEALKRQTNTGSMGPLCIGSYPPQGIGCAGLIDEVRIVAGARPVMKVPEGPADARDAIGLWRFDEIKAGQFADGSASQNPAVVGLPVAAALPPKAAPGQGKGPDYVANPGLKTILIDRSPDESFLSIRADTAGRLFVGGREGVFVFEPDDRGGYRSKQLLYRFPPDSWVTDIEIRGDDLYVMTNAALYLLPGARLRRDGIRPGRLIWGMPVDSHVTMHGMAWGPEGDLYYGTGDPLLNYGDIAKRPDHWGHWTIHAQPDGTAIPYNGPGGIFRCRPDGSAWRVVARGTRATCGIVFDRQWNLFADDNDHESRASDYSPSRLLHVTPHADLGWPRGWSAQKTPERADVLAITAGLGREVPVGLSYYDEPFLPPEYRGRLLLARWGQRSIDRFRPEPRGSSFDAASEPLLTGDGTARPVGVTVGRGGRIFALVCYMFQNEGSPKYISDLVMLTRQDDPDNHPFEAYEAPTASSERLWAELSDPSWWRRNRAHQEILRRGGDLLIEVTRRLKDLRADDPSADLLPWLAAASGSAEAGHLLIERARNRDPDVRLQAIRALGESPKLGAPRELFVGALSDPSPPVALAALVALMEREGPVPDELIRGPAISADTYLRQTSATFLADRATVDDLLALARSDDPRVRLAGVLASGIKLTIPGASEPIPESLPLRYDSPNATFTIPYADGTIDLRSLGRVGSFTAAERWKNAQRSDIEDRLFGLLFRALDDRDDAVRLQAAHDLDLLDDTRAVASIARVRREAADGKLEGVAARRINQVWYLGPFTDVDDRPSRRPEDGPIDLTAGYGTRTAERHWQLIAAADDQPRPAVSSEQPGYFYAYFRLQAARRSPARLRVAGRDPVIWQDGRRLDDPDGARLDLQPGSNDLLIRVHHDAGAISLEIEFRATDQVAATVPEKLGLATLAERLKAGAAGSDATIGPEFNSIDWTRAVAEGDPRRGRALFGRDGLGCVKCHAIAPDQEAGGGPSLAGAARRFTVAHVVESVLLPSHEIAPVFRASRLALNDGRLLDGLIVSETADALEILRTDATRATIARHDIEDRRPLDISPMPAGLVRTPNELRDLLAYLFGDNPTPP